MPSPHCNKRSVYKLSVSKYGLTCKVLVTMCLLGKWKEAPGLSEVYQERDQVMASCMIRRVNEASYMSFLYQDT